MADSVPDQRVGVGAKVGYGVGQIGGQIFRDTPAILLGVYLITVLGVPPWMAGLAIVIPKIWVIFCDPLVGAWSDRRNVRHGRRAFILAGAIGSAVGFVVLFTAPDFANPWYSVAFTVVTFTLASTGFSLFSVPYLSMASELSDDPHERTAVLTYRLGFTAVGIIIGIGMAQPLAAWFGGGRHGFLLMALVIGAVMFASMMATWVATRTIRFQASESEGLPLGQQMKVAVANKPFRILAITYILQNLGSAFGYFAFPLVFLYIIKDLSIIILFMSVSAGAIIIAQPFWLALSRKVGKKNAYIASMVGWALVSLTWLFAGPDQDVLFTSPITGAFSTQDGWLMLRSFMMGVFNSGYALMAFSMLTDTVEYDRRVTGTSHAGVFSGVFNAIEKASFAIGPALAGVTLSAMGFVASKTGVVPQTPTALWSLLLNQGILPAALALIASVIVLAYHIPEEER